MTDITRYDRNLATNAISFQQYGEEATFIKHIALYLAYKWQHQNYTSDLFGKTVFDPVDFAKVMNYKNYLSLLEPHKKPLQFQNKSAEQIKLLKGGHKDRNRNAEPAWDTILCNALYTMYTRPLIFTYGGKTPAGTTFSELHQLQFFKSLTKHRHSVTGKIHYEYEIGESFKNNLARYFLRINTITYAKLRNYGLQDLYTKIILHKTNSNNPDQTLIIDHFSFDELCALVGTHCAAFSDNKKYITLSFKRLNEINGFPLATLTWTKSNDSRFKVRPVIEVLFNVEEKQRITDDHYERFKLYLFNNLKQSFTRLFPSISHSHNIKNNAAFKEWLQRKDHDFKEKWANIREAYELCFGKSLSETDSLLYKYADDITIMYNDMLN